MYDEDSRKRVALMLQQLADGESVQLGEFSTQADPIASDADLDAETLRKLAAEL